ncbi:MAG: HAD family phosphatase [Gammaproteobacteria bacterium]|nr:HAD family phosphatase [Gammaproteobacteria bacterium]MBI5616823.1 HAD family phosphatase [Gammaproteobacteria bacterium]
MKDTVLLFDLGGVLVENELFAALGAMLSGTLPEAELKARWLASPAVRCYETGGMTDEAFATALVAELDLPMTPAAFIPAFQGWVKGFYPGAIALLGALRRHYRVGCLSNSNALHWIPEYESSFDFSYSSHKTGVIKPDRAAFARVTELQGLVPAQVLYFDDSTANVTAANAFGFQAHQTVGFGELEQTLTALGILPL